jgi:hypothetical protein
MLEERFPINGDVPGAAASDKRNLSEVMIMNALLIAIEKRKVDPDGSINTAKNSLAGEMGPVGISHVPAV